jgi:haloalkane dehalogenase
VVTQPSPRPHGPERPVVPADEPFADQYPFESHWLNVGDDDDPLWLHYVDEGPRDAPVLLFLHGNPTWSFMWRRQILALRDRFRCVAVDHMGCGLSDRPQTQFDYTLPRHADNVEKLLDHLGVERFTPVLHDWGGMIGMTVATRRPEAYEAGVVMNTAAFLGKLPTRIALVRIPVFGPNMVLRGNAFAKAAIRQAVTNKRVMTDSVTRGFLAPYGTPHDRIATLRFVEDVPQKPGHRTWDVVHATDEKLAQLTDRPLLVVWGLDDWCFTTKFRDGWMERFPDAEVVNLPRAGHYVFEDAADQVTEAMTRFLARTHAAPAAAE